MRLCFLSILIPEGRHAVSGCDRNLFRERTIDSWPTKAFVVAWGGMASQTAHIIGLVILSLELRELGIPRLEFFCVIGALLIGMGNKSYYFVF